MVAVLTGAGISTDSGIPDFRGPQGVWTRNPAAEKLYTYDNYMSDPEVRRSSWLARLENPAWEAEPNAAHRALVTMEHCGVPMRILTQNIDGLHQKAGSSPRKVVELHGTMFTVRCMSCSAESTMRQALDRVEAGEPDPRCLRCSGILKAGTIMFGEMLNPDVLDQAARIAMNCEEFWAVGTSLRVEQSAALCAVAVERGARLIIINAEPTPYDELAAEVIREPISEALPRLVARVLDGHVA
jgi:NAD-dependent deacetylase